MSTRDRSAGARQLLCMLALLAHGRASAQDLMRKVGLSRSTLYRTRSQAASWGVEIHAGEAGWEVVCWGVFSVQALRRVDIANHREAA